jgi:hypothetical protein
VSINWGDAPTWIAGIFAGAAAIYARGMLKSQQKQIAEQREFIAEQSANLALERAGLRAAAEERRSAQAKQVTMSHQTAGGRPDEEGNVDGYDHWVVNVRNASDAPIRQVRVRFGDVYVAVSAEELESLSLPDGGRRPATVDLLGPGRTLIFRSPRWQEVTVDNHPPKCFFTDADGVQWSRDRHGQLCERAADE